MSKYLRNWRPPAPPDWRESLRPALLVVIVTFLIYAPSLRSGFVYDAELQVLMDPYIHTPSHFVDVLTLRVMNQDVLDSLRPAHLFFLMGDALLWGRNPMGYHLTSNLLHALNAGMVCLLLLLLIPSGPIRPRHTVAILSSLIFATHPLQVEAVAEVSYREDLLATGFLLVALLAATRFPQCPRCRVLVWGTGIVVAIALACLSKETGVTGPFLLAASACIFHRAQPWMRWGILVFAAGLVAGGFVLARFTLPPEESLIFVHKPDYLGGSLAAVFRIQPRLWAFLLRNLVWPVSLSADYVPQNVVWMTLPWALGILAGTLTLQGLLAARSRLAALGALVFWLGLAPVSNFMPLFRPLADRFLYLPMVGVALTIAGTLTLGTTSTRWRGITLILTVLLLLPLVGLTLQRQRVFSSALTLWEDTLRVSPSSATAADNLAYAHLEAGDLSEALQSFCRARELTHGKMADAAAGAAVVYERLGQPESAEGALLEAIRADPRYAQPQQLVKTFVVTPEHAEALSAILSRVEQPPPRMPAR